MVETMLCIVIHCYILLQAVEAKVLDNLSEQTTAEKSASKTAQDIKSLRKQGMSSSAVDFQGPSPEIVEQCYTISAIIMH